MKFLIKNFFSICEQIRSLLRIWSYSLHFLYTVDQTSNFFFKPIDWFLRDRIIRLKWVGVAFKV